MTDFLCFRLHGPLAAWGDIAVGERRPSLSQPSRSAVLGLVAAALGLTRHDADALAALENEVGFASRTEAPGELLVDYHTAQGPSEKLLRKRQAEGKRSGVQFGRPSTRYEELSFPSRELDTILSQRQYRVEAAWTIALWNVAQGEWPVRRLAEALRRPVFVPYLGRKSCPLDIPMEPQLLTAANPIAAIAAARFQSDAVLGDVLKKGEGKQSVRWEGRWEGLESVQTTRRRDRVLSRARWQFSERDEHSAPWPLNGGTHVPVQG